MRTISMLRQERTEFGKSIRKLYETGEVKLKRMQMKVWKPRPDGISNTISTVTKDTMLIEYEDTNQDTKRN